jgi:molybdenum cofactor cytidylyltransferase
MKFGPVPLADAQGGILAHSLRTGDHVLKKGHVLGSADIAQLRDAQIEKVVIARLEDGDVPENEAAARVAQHLAGDGIRVAQAFTGRANLYATKSGLLLIDPECINGINAVDDAITVATLPPFQRIAPGQMVATIKIIPFAAPSRAVERIEQRTPQAPIKVAGFRRRAAALILTTLTGARPALLEKTRRAIEHRIRSIGSELVFQCDVPHTEQTVASALEHAARMADLILVFGASAITDRRDVIPMSVERAGGRVEHFGMPVDPGNLLMIGKLGDTDVVGLPGCARSPKLNGFDFVLWRLAAGLPVGKTEIVGMGVGGLLMEIPVRPQPREEKPAKAAPKIGAVVLAAGASSRMGSDKLLTELGGQAMVRRVVEAVLGSEASPVIVVTGHKAEAVREALPGHSVRFINNPDFPSGLSSSLKLGLKALPEDCDGAVIVLGDMPAVTPALIDKLIGAFAPAEGRALCVATHGGKRGNPVLFARRFFEEIESIEGDVGARGLIGAYPDLVCEVEADSDAPLIDIDTPEDLAAYRRRGT